MSTAVPDLRNTFDAGRARTAVEYQAGWRLMDALEASIRDHVLESGDVVKPLSYGDLHLQLGLEILELAMHEKAGTGKRAR